MNNIRIWIELEKYVYNGAIFKKENDLQKKNEKVRKN